MTTVLLIVQIMISIVLIGLILMQKSEGGALGIGGGGGGMMSGRSSTNALIKMTAILGTLFIVNCLALSIFFTLENQGSVFSGENPDIALIEEADSSNTESPLADDSALVPATDITLPENDATPSQTEQ